MADTVSWYSEAAGWSKWRHPDGDQEKTFVGRATAGWGPFAIHAEGARRKADNYNVPDVYGSERLPDSFTEISSYSFTGTLAVQYTDGRFGGINVQQPAQAVSRRRL